MSVTETTKYERGRSILSVYRTIRRSFLLSLAMFGLIMTIFGGVVVQSMGHGTMAAILGAAGITWMLVGFIGYGLYRLLERWY